MRITWKLVGSKLSASVVALVRAAYAAGNKAAGANASLRPEERLLFVLCSMVAPFAIFCIGVCLSEEYMRPVAAIMSALVAFLIWLLLKITVLS